MIRFSAPFMLLLLPVLWAGLAWTWRRTFGMNRSRKRWAFALRALLLSCIVMALAGPESHRPNKGMCTVFVLDRSDSISDAEREYQQQFVNDAVRALGPDDQAAVVVFGAEPVVDTAPGKYPDMPKIVSTVRGSGSNLAAALRLATASFPDGKARRIVLISDGNETSGDTLQAAQVASADGIPIDYVSLQRDAKRREFSVTDLESPSDTRVDEPFELYATIDASTATVGQLSLDRNGELVKRLTVQLNPGRNRVVIPDSLVGPGFYRYRATLTVNGDTDPRNNIGAGFTNVRGRPRLLVLQEPGKNHLVNALRQQGMLVDVALPGQVPTRPEGLQGYDAILLNDFNATYMGEPQMKMIQGAVRDTGMGLAMIGGENSFLPGGYYGSPIAEALPVDLNIRQRKNFPSTSILIVADTSGSMGMIEDGQPKVRLAAKAAQQTVEMMSALDRVGVAGSTDSIEFVAPMQDCSNKGSIITQIQRLDVGGGGIYIAPSLEFAREHLRKETSKVRHLILLADGADCDQIEGQVAVGAALRAEKITTTCVSIGDGQFVPFLKQLAAASGGQFYLAQKAGQLPAIFTQDAAIMSRSAIEEGVFMPKLISGEEVLRGISATPSLMAYCLTDLKPLARVGMKTQKDDPLLASWQYGLGTALAFTSDAQNRWAAQWVGWGQFSSFWAQAARTISRRVSDNRYQIQTKLDGGKGKVTVAAKDPAGNPINNLPATVSILAPDGSSREVHLAQDAPGSYQGEFDADQLGSYIVTIAEDAPGGVKRTSVSGFSIPYPSEYRAFRANTSLLERVSQVTGGSELKEPSRAFAKTTLPGKSIQELWPVCLTLAAIILPFDIACRRIALPFAALWAGFLRLLRREKFEDAPQQRLARLQRARTEKPSATSAPPLDLTTIDAPRPSAPVPQPEPEPKAQQQGEESLQDRLLKAKRERK